MEFTLRAEHDLLASRALFGPTTAARYAPDPLPFRGVSPTPLVLRSARQAMTATFGAEGFQATVGLPTVHRETSLVLAAGWVVGPKPFPEDEDAYLRGTSGD
ncbi:hypothetical protein ACH4E5_13175 [Streptomyces afghaniensis]|uniref:hypothetical protein n=1 Tax=Streptomyces afghaniensis TaxID=66865 RepID=UPI003790D08F